MPRYNTTEILNQITTRLPDNTVGTITPSVMRSILNDVVMTLRGTGAYMAGTTGVAHNFTSSAFQQVPGLYTSEQTRDATEIAVDMAAGQFTALFASDYSINASYTFDGNTNENIVAGIAIDGVVGDYFKSQSQMDGAGNEVEFNLSGVVRLQVGQKVEVMFSATTSPTTVTIANAGITCTLLPSRV